jgi:hypothetical protein
VYQFNTAAKVFLDFNVKRHERYNPVYIYIYNDITTSNGRNFHGELLTTNHINTVNKHAQVFMKVETFISHPTVVPHMLTALSSGDLACGLYYPGYISQSIGRRTAP